MKANHACQRKNLLVLKIGGSVLTRTSEESRTDAERIAQIAKEISMWWEAKLGQLILVLGAGSFGHPLARRFELNNPASTKSSYGFALTVCNMIALAKTVLDDLSKNCVPCLPIQPSAFFTLDRGRIARAELPRIELALADDLVPVLWGDAVLDLSEKFGILSGDQIAAYFYEKLPVKRLLFGTDVDGVYTSDPKKGESAKRIGSLLEESEIADILANTGPSKSFDVTGGLRGKLLEICQINRRPIECQIFNASVRGYTQKALNLENIGTLINLTKTKVANMERDCLKEKKRYTNSR
jgi:isopentenyl phosphate kinase